MDRTPSISGPRRDSGRGRRSLTARWLVRFGYDGRGFAGWARQPGERTVEGEIRSGVRKFGLDPAPLRLEVASRTDRGVSARANALGLETDLPGPTLLRALNGISPRIFFSAATPVPEGFRLRAATRRVYRYYDPQAVLSPARRRAATRLFAGRVDVRSLGRSVPGGRPHWRTIESVVSRGLAGGSVIEVRAPSFVWGMVRKIVGALREVDAGRLPVARLRSALRGQLRLTLPIAEPEPLVLWEVEYPLSWQVRWDGPTRHQARATAAERRTLWARQWILDELEPPAGSDLAVRTRPRRAA
jgi:tRNA pseudouridine38-40 synthase